MSATECLARAYREDVELWIEPSAAGPRLLFRAKYTLPDDLREELREHKPAVVKLLQQNQRMKELGWQVLNFGELYLWSIHPQSDLMALREAHDRFDLTRYGWSPGKPKPSYQKVVASRVEFPEMLERAQSYLQYIEKNRKEV